MSQRPKPTSIEDARLQAAGRATTVKNEIRDELISRVETAISQAIHNSKTTAEIPMDATDACWGYIQEILKEEYPGYTLEFQTQTPQKIDGYSNIPDMMAAMSRASQTIKISWG